MCLPTTRWWLSAAAVVVLMLTALAPLGAVEEARDLRGDVPSAAAVRARLTALQEARASAEADLALLGKQLEEAVEALSSLSTADQLLAARIEKTRESTLEMAVDVFISDSPNAGVHLLFEIEAASDMRWSQHLLDNALSAPVRDNASLLRELEGQADAELLEAVSHIEELRSKIERLAKRLDDLDEQRAESDALLVIANAWDRADTAIAESPYGFAPRERWEKLRYCESAHDYRAVSPSGVYRGAYQFDRTTWRSVGGTGDPASAEPREQDARARELYALRGHQPWPVCGRHIR